MSPLTTALLASAAAFVLFGGRRAALFSLIAASIVFTRGESLAVGGLSLYPTRLLMLAGFVRVVMRGELSQIRWNGLDRVVLIAYVYCTAVFVLRTIAGHGTIDIAQVSLSDRIGTLADVALAYFSIRSLLKGSDDLVWLFSTLVYVLIPYVALLAVERATGANPFSAIGGFGGIWADPERLRCRGSFMHPSLLGSFGASLVPVYIGIFLSRQRSFMAAVGLLCALAIVSLANSGGPWIFAVATIVAWALWPARKYMRPIRYGILAMFVMLAIVMKAPIWYLPSRVSDLFGGDGWHRSYLIHQAVNHLGDWWLAGMPLNEATQWFPYLVQGGLDITNLFIAFGLDSGLLGIGLLIAVFVVAYSRLGHQLRGQSPAAVAANDVRLIYWALGAALTGHLVNFFAITYFDQTYVLWLLLLASVASLSLTDAPAVPVAAPEPPRRFFTKEEREGVTARLERPIPDMRRRTAPTARTPR